MGLYSEGVGFHSMMILTYVVNAATVIMSEPPPMCTSMDHEYIVHSPPRLTNQFPLVT